MTYTPDYHIDVNDGKKIPLLFNSWTYRQFCKKTGFELDQLLADAFNNKVFKSENFSEILLTAAESYCRFNSKEFTFTDLDSFVWIDNLGGYYNSPKTKEILKIFLKKLLNMPPEQFEEMWNKSTQKANDHSKEDKKKGKPK